MKCKLENCTGIGEIQWMELQLAEVPHDDRALYTLNNAERLRKEYCESYCPVTKFKRKYEHTR